MFQSDPDNSDNNVEHLVPAASSRLKKGEFIRGLERLQTMLPFENVAEGEAFDPHDFRPAST